MDVRVFFSDGCVGGSAFAQVGNPERGQGGVAADFFFVSRMVALGLLPLCSVRCRFFSVNAGWVGCGSLSFVLFLVL